MPAPPASRPMSSCAAAWDSPVSRVTAATTLGAELFIHSKTCAPAETLSRWGDGANIILSTASSVESANAAFLGLAPNGTLVLLGAGPGDVSLSPMALVMGRRRVMGSPAGSRKDLRDTLAFAADHGVRPRVTRFPLERANEALRAMNERALRGRAVLVMD
jgi:alcohol dehydrogenase, propanol-preferring